MTQTRKESDIDPAQLSDDHSQDVTMETPWEWEDRSDLFIYDDLVNPADGIDRTIPDDVEEYAPYDLPYEAPRIEPYARDVRMPCNIDGDVVHADELDHDSDYLARLEPSARRIRLCALLVFLLLVFVLWGIAAAMQVKTIEHDWNPQLGLAARLSGCDVDIRPSSDSRAWFELQYHRDGAESVVHFENDAARWLEVRQRACDDLPHFECRPRCVLTVYTPSEARCGAGCKIEVSQNAEDLSSHLALTAFAGAHAGQVHFTGRTLDVNLDRMTVLESIAVEAKFGSSTMRVAHSTLPPSTRVLSEYGAVHVELLVEPGDAAPTPLLVRYRQNAHRVCLPAGSMVDDMPASACALGVADGASRLARYYDVNRDGLVSEDVLVFQYLGACRRRTPRTRVDPKVA